jgi:hypothetical protein
MTRHQSLCIFMFLYETILQQVDCVGVPCLVVFLFGGNPRIKTPLHGYPRSTLGNSIIQLVQNLN